MTAAPQRKGLWVAGWVAFAAITLWFSFHIHSRSAPFTYKSQIFADKAGYYIYLPATFVFGFDADAVPDSLSQKVGNGFLITDQNKIYTKYPIGVSLMQSPFFLLAHGVLSPLTGQPADGFSPVYHAMVDIAAWAYMLLGMGMLLIAEAAAFRRPHLGDIGTVAVRDQSRLLLLHRVRDVAYLLVLRRPGLDPLAGSGWMCHVALSCKVGKRSSAAVSRSHLAHTETLPACPIPKPRNPHPSPKLTPRKPGS
ncbi:MAG: hypothetical protein U0176_05710 [Bacteroidia bacterium]